MKCFGSTNSYVPSSGLSLFLSKVNHTISNAIVIITTYEISYTIHKIEVKLIPLCNSIEIIYWKFNIIIQRI
jgi:hypothetical protein